MPVERIGNLDYNQFADEINALAAEIGALASGGEQAMVRTAEPAESSAGSRANINAELMASV